MSRNVNDIIKSLPASRRRKIEKRAAALVAEEMTLQELRRARAMTQVRLAKNLGVAQKQISEFEKRTDMHISTEAKRRGEICSSHAVFSAPTGTKNAARVKVQTK